MTIVYGKNCPINEPTPVLLRGYGAYGTPVSTECGDTEKFFLKQGWKVAYAHVRGGGELGGKWYDDGRKEKKENSIIDYLVCIVWKYQQLCIVCGVCVLSLNIKLCNKLIICWFLNP
eukprot:m.69232 g.69232  ORF g.69232 m.69232 type:complete len:117 (+) comp8267_c0_seq12:1885-2235(+)